MQSATVGAFGPAGVARPVTRAIGWVRVAVGAGLLLRPRWLPATVAFHAGSAPDQQWLVQMMAAREAGLGVGTLAALRAGDGLRPWLWAQALSDAGDAVAFLSLTGRPVGRRRAAGLAGFAVSGALADLLLARALRYRQS